MKCKKCRKEISDDCIFCPQCGAKQIVTQRKRIRRENGAGTIYKRSDVKVAPWVARTQVDKNNKRQVIGNYETAAEAKSALEEYRLNPTTKLNITVKELRDEWQPLGYKDKSHQLCDCYNAAWAKLTDIYHIKFRELRTAQMQSIIEELQVERPKLDKDGNQVVKEEKLQTLDPMSYSSLSKIKILLGLLYKYAMENDIVNKNYAEFLILPKKSGGVKDCFSDLELKKIENAVGKVPFADCILFMCYTGLRITEFLTLNKMSVHNVDGVCALTGGIKTDAGKNRVVPIHSKIQPILDEWMGKGGDTIFCRSDGTAYPVKYFREKCFAPALKQIGVSALTPHATRRTFATRMAASNARPEDIEKLMGHTDYAVDVESYIKQSTETLSKAIEKLS